MQNLGGKLEIVRLNSHATYTPEIFTSKFQQDSEQSKQMSIMYSLGKYSEIWSLYPLLTSKKPWTTLAESALKDLDIQFALRVYRQLGNAAMVQNLQRLLDIEDRVELQGHISIIFGDFQYSQQCFGSSNPNECLKLKIDLGEYKNALEMASLICPDMQSPIALDYAMQLEMDALAGESHDLYKLALETSLLYKSKSQSEFNEHINFCESGYIRTTFRLGDIAEGMKLIANSCDKRLIFECASILKDLKQFNEAAQLLEQGEDWEEAAKMYMKLKNWPKVSKIIDVFANGATCPALFSQLAKAHEAEGRYSEAANAYDRAGDYSSLVRILVDNLGQIEAASILVKRIKNSECAKKLAKIHSSARNFQMAIEFYLIAGLQAEAFSLSKSQNMVNYFAELVKEDASMKTLEEIAAYFEINKEFYNAGRYYFQAMKYPQALKNCLNAPVDDQAITLAISIIGEAKSDSLTHTLIDFLMGERDGQPKDAKYIFTLYMSNSLIY